MGFCSDDEPAANVNSFAYAVKAAQVSCFRTRRSATSAGSDH